MAMGTGGDGSYNSEINVTPLVDVMLVLLVVFMVTAPMLQTGVDLDLPETVAAKIEDPEGTLTLSIDPARKLSLNGAAIKWTELQSFLRNHEKLQKDKQLFIAAHKDLPYAVVVTAMAAAQQAGIAKVQLLTDTSDEIDLASLDNQTAAAPPAPAPQ